MNSRDTFDTLESLIAEFQKQLGLNRFKTEAVSSAIDLQYYLRFSYVMDFSDLRNYKSAAEAVRPIFEDIENSPYVKNLTSNLEFKVEMLRKEVEELKPYKTYYDLHYKMENGK